jgi:NADPH:quinone reductase-like Zn-dependent oxidoreductase
MKAAVYTKYGSPEVVQVEEIEKPIPKDNEILIKVHATTVTTVDSIFRRGKQFFARMATGIIKPKSNILGTEFAGEVESVGITIQKFKPGAKVFGDSSITSSTHAEYLCVRGDEPLALIPEGMSYVQAASVPYAALTALPFLRDNGKIQSGQKVLILGASGSVGNFAVQLAKYYGVEVTGVCSTRNVELVKSLGADQVIDYTKQDFTQSEETYDIIFDTVGKSSFSRCKGSLKRPGIYLTTVIGFGILFKMLLTSKSKKKAVIAFTGLRPAAERVTDLLFIRELLQTGKLKPVIDREYSLEEIIEAYRYVDQGHKKGSVVINIMQNDQS